ncbi:MAG TPA: response regulator [Vicinamibacteria bacterium]|nr:response regulator [Vicinamibacteria bacterium]
MAELKLLLVDDEPEFLEPMKARLERRGVACSTASSGEEALRVLATTPVECAVVDVKMPGMDGLELLRQVRRHHPGVAVVLLTGHASVELGVQGMELGAFEYLLKPVELDELLDTARRAVAAAR